MQKSLGKLSMRKIQTLFVLIVILLGMLTQAFAVNPDEVLSNSVLEERARSLSAQIRCLVCQNQSIDDSDATLARDLRVLVREKLVEGMDDQQILDHLVDRYGEFVLLKPKFGAHTLLLWGIPIIGLILGLIAMMGLFKRADKQQEKPSPLSKSEQKALSKILEDK